MEKKDTLSSCSESEEQQMQLIQDKSKESCMVSFQRLHSHLKCLLNNDLKGSRTEDGFKRAFTTLFCQDLETFTGTMFLNMDQLQKQLDNNEFQEIGSMASFKVLETQLILDASLVIIESNGTESQKQDTSSRSGNDAHVNDADIRPIYNEEPMAEVQTTDDNVSATGQQHTEQPEFNNEGKVDQNAEQCHDIRPLPAKLTDNMTTKLSDQSLESENVCLKKTVAQCQKDFAKLEAHCINLELQLQMENQVLKEGQQGQFLNVQSNEAKVKNDIDVSETINIELEHSVAKLLAENEQLHKEKEHLKQTYKDLFDSIKSTRVQTKNQNDSLMEQLNKKSNENADVLAQIQKKGFAIAALKNELRKLTGNSVNTKFAKPSILGKPVGQPLKNHRWFQQERTFAPTVQQEDKNEPQMDSNADIPNQYQALVFMEMTSVHNSSCLVLHQMTSDHHRSDSGIMTTARTVQCSKLVSKVVLGSGRQLHHNKEYGINNSPSYSNAEAEHVNKYKIRKQKISKKNLLDMSLGIDNIYVLRNVD
ncbi:hypothetical protein Tco_1098394 [Tanacetum coccineum]